MTDNVLPEQLATELRDRLSAHVADAAKLLSASLCIPSVTGGEAAYADFVEAWARARGWEFECLRLDDERLSGLSGIAEEERPSERWNLRLRPWARSGRPLLVINGHLDVVPPGEAERWSGDPFDGRIESGVVYGRGAVDTKGPILAALLGVEALCSTGLQPDVDLEFHLVVGEERSGIGTRAALAAWDTPDQVIVLEPSGSEIVAASTGLIAFEITTHGASAHTSAPWEGHDALQHAVRIYSALTERESKRNQAARAGEFAGIPAPVPFVIGTFQAGRFRNAVPDHAGMVGRLGLLPGEDPAAALEELRAFIASIDAAAAWPFPSEAVAFHGLAGWRTDAEQPIVRAMRSAAETHGAAADLRALTAGSDAGYYGALGVPTVLFGPGNMALAHSPDEHIEIDEVLAAALIIGLAVAALGDG